VGVRIFDAILLMMTKAELEAAIALANTWSGRSTLILAIGILGEYVGLPFLENKRWHKHAKVFFAILVVAGIVGEYEFSSQIAQNAFELQRISDGELKDATDKATKANLKLFELESKMIEVFGPRRLDKAQSGRIASKLSSLAGMKIDVFALAVGNPWSKTEAEDSLQLTRDLVGALNSANMDATGWLSSCENGFGTANLLVSITGETAREKEIGNKVIEALAPEVDTFPELQTSSDFSLFCKTTPLEPSTLAKRRPDAKLSIVTGRKIPALLTPEQLGLAPSK
jgi:hypothetical protein